MSSLLPPTDDVELGKISEEVDKAQNAADLVEEQCRQDDDEIEKLRLEFEDAQRKRRDRQRERETLRIAAEDVKRRAADLREEKEARAETVRLRQLTKRQEMRILKEITNDESFRGLIKRVATNETTESEKTEFLGRMYQKRTMMSLDDIVQDAKNLYQKTATQDIRRIRAAACEAILAGLLDSSELEPEVPTVR